MVKLIEAPPQTAAPARAPAIRRRLILITVLVLLVALVGETIWFAPFAGNPAPPARTPAPLPLADVNPYGANVFLDKEVDPFKKTKTMQMVKDAGLSWIKQEFPWSELEFRKGYFWDDRNAKSSWAKFDEIVDLAQQNGVRVIARLDRAPDWARAPGSNPEAPPANLQDFGDFITAFVTHYKGRIQFLQIWNEPNLAREWDLTKAVNPQAYVALLKVAARSARAADPDVMILAAPLATTLEKPPSQNLDELDYLDQMYQAGAQDAFDIMAANAYGLNHPPEDPPDPATLNFRRVELLRQVMERHGDGQKAIWFNEYGWNAPDPSLPNAAANSADPTAPNSDRPWGTVTLAQQADYTVRGIAWAQQHWPWAGVFTIWYFRQVGDIAATSAEYYFQMLSFDWVAQPVYNRVQAAAHDQGLAGPGTYDELAPAVVAPAGWTLHHDPGAAQGISLLATVASDTLRLRFQGTDLALAVGSSISGSGAGSTARLFVTVDGGTAHVAASVPRDAQGRPYLGGQGAAANGTQGRDPGQVSAAPLHSPAAGDPQQVSIVSGLDAAFPPAIHTVELTPDGPGVTFDGFVVESTRSYIPFIAITALLGGVVAALLVLLRRGPRATGG